jgi:hypothetical protein
MTTSRHPDWARVAGSQVQGEASAWSQSAAFNVNLNNGNVNNNNRNNSGFGLACRRAREFQGAGAVQLRDLDRAWWQARRGKKPSMDKARFDSNFTRELRLLQAELNTGTWRPGPVTSIVVTRPKTREIHAPAFRDRVVHHLIVPQLEARYEHRFYAHSYANRPGRGIHAAIGYAQSCMRQVHSGQLGGWYLKLDIHNCFNAIRRDILWAMMKPVLVRTHLPDPLLRAMHSLLSGSPLQAGVRQYATAEQIALIPPHKRLCNAPKHCGLPPGNLSSQFLANVYLDALDQFVKHELRAKRYLRYVDDFVLFHHDRRQLEDWLQCIECFLRDKLALRLKDDIQLRPITDGLDFLGYVIFPTHRLVRRRVVSHLHEALAGWQSWHVRARAMRATSAELERFRAVLASYRGHFKHADSHRLQARLQRQFPWLEAAARPRRFSHRLHGRRVTIRTPRR